MVSVFCEAYNRENGNCITCKYGFSPANGECRDPYCVSQTINGCQSCQSSFSVNSNMYCEYSDVNCRNPTPTRCIDCNSGFFVNLQGMCRPLPPRCVAANIQTELCL